MRIKLYNIYHKLNITVEPVFMNGQVATKLNWIDKETKENISVISSRNFNDYADPRYLKQSGLVLLK